MTPDPCAPATPPRWSDIGPSSNRDWTWSSNSSSHRLYSVPRLLHPCRGQHPELHPLGGTASPRCPSSALSCRRTFYSRHRHHRCHQQVPPDLLPARSSRASSRGRTSDGSGSPPPPPLRTTRPGDLHNVWHWSLPPLPPLSPPPPLPPTSCSSTQTSSQRRGAAAVAGGGTETRSLCPLTLMTSRPHPLRLSLTPPARRQLVAALPTNRMPPSH